MILIDNGVKTDLCGFFGIYSASGGVSQQKSEIIDAGRTLIHRGPDDEGHFFDDYFGIHFQRLAIIDTSRFGHQPMASDDGRLVLAFNGEVYNYRELRQTLENRGHHFKGHSDSEVVLAAYSEWGEGCVDHFRGMFALICWDRVNMELLVMRDRLGIKPLYMYQDGETCLFASEIKAILRFCPKAGIPNDDAVFKYLARGWLDDSTETFFADIRCMEPGTSLCINSRGITKRRYWRIPEGDSLPFDRDAFLDRFSETVSLHLQSDVSIAATLSGGMDSSSIVTIASHAKKGIGCIQAFSVIPPGTVDESPWIDSTVKLTGIKHQYLNPTWQQMPELIDEVIGFHDEPIQSSSCIYQYLLRREVAAQGIKVLLVGEGGDEVLGGYRRLLLPYLYALEVDGQEELFNRALRGGSAFLGINSEAMLLKLAGYRNLIEKGGSGQENKSGYSLLEDDFIDRNSECIKAPAYPAIEAGNSDIYKAHLRQHLAYRDIPYVLRMEDRNSMAHGIEARVPFLDHRLMEQTFSYDYSEFMLNGENKSMLRRSMKNILPSDVLGRKDKSPRPGSDVHFVYDLLYDRIRDILNPRNLIESKWWRKDCAQQFEKDREIRNPTRAEAWFRIYNVSRWSSLIRPKT